VVTIVPSATPTDPGGPRQTMAATIRPVVVLVAAVVVPVGPRTSHSFRSASQAPAATVALGFAVLVSLLAATGTRLSALIAAVSAALCYDIGFTQPYGSLVISHPQDIETTALLLVGGLIVGPALGSKSLLTEHSPCRQREDLSHVQAIAELMAAGAGPDEVVEAVANELRSLLGLRKCWFDTFAPGATRTNHRQNGNVSWGRIWWGVDTLGLPGKEITIEVEHDVRRLGRFVLVAEAGTKVRRDQLLAAVTLADQAGASLGAGPMPVALAHR